LGEREPEYYCELYGSSPKKIAFEPTTAPAQVKKRIAAFVEAVKIVFDANESVDSPFIVDQRPKVFSGYNIVDQMHILTSALQVCFLLVSYKI
jgi:rhamnose utilization protein RhaD (predicted bifunctional aldolase and dehydrogenase)